MSCRDFATLMIAALRSLGITMRFVSGDAAGRPGFRPQHVTRPEMEMPYPGVTLRPVAGEDARSLLRCIAARR